MDPDALWFASHLVLSSQLGRLVPGRDATADSADAAPRQHTHAAALQGYVGHLRSTSGLGALVYGRERRAAGGLALTLTPAPSRTLHSIGPDPLCTSSSQEHSLGGSADAEDAGSLDADDDALATWVPDAHEVALPSCSLEAHAAPADEDTLVSTTAPADDDSLLSSAAPADEDSVVSSPARPCPNFAELCAFPKLAARRLHALGV